MNKKIAASILFLAISGVMPALPALAAAPETTLDSAPVDPSHSTTATFTFHSSQAGSTFQCFLDAGAYVPCTTPKTYTGLPAGLHDFRVKAVNAAHEVDASASAYAWSIIADPTWTQTDWTGGADLGSGATHPANQTGWNKYSSVSSTSGTTSPGNVVLSTSNFSATDDGTLTTTGSATGGKFPNGARLNTTVSGSGAGASVALTGSGLAAAGLAGIPGRGVAFGATLLRNGSDDVIYALEGSDPDDVTPARGFSKFTISTNTWTSLAEVPGDVFLGATIIRNGSDNDIYLLQANHSTGFFKYSISGNSWTPLAAVPAPVGSGASIIRDGSSNTIFLLEGNGDTGFFKYSISGNSWTTLATVPGAVGTGGKLIRNGSDNDIYALQGNGATGFFRYSISANSWTTRAAVPAPVLFGGTIIRNGGDNDIYALQGNFDNGFFRYSISADTWTPLANVPFNAYFGAFLLRNGSENSLYLLQGWDEHSDTGGTGFFKYSISGNTWSRLASAPASVYFGSYAIRNGSDNEIYVLPGDKGNGFLKYSISSDSWAGPYAAAPDAPGFLGRGGGIIRNGGDDAVYVLQGLSRTGFYKYSVSAKTWTTLAPTPAPIAFAGALIRNGSDNDIYVLQGNVAKGFYRYSISGNSWTTLATVPANVSEGAKLIRNGGDSDLYLLRGGGTTGFFKYSITSNSWTPLAAAPSAVGLGSSLIRNAITNTIFLLPGNGSTAFSKYSIAANTWTPLAPTPGAIGAGSSLIRNGGDDAFFALQGGDATGFYKYSVSADSWTPLAAVPASVGSGGYLIRNGSDNDIYALQGRSAGFFKYSITGNSWSPLPTVPTPVGEGGALLRNGADNTIFILNGNATPHLWLFSINAASTFPPSGKFTSAVIDVDTHGATAFGNLSWSPVLSPGTSITLATRTGATPTPDGTWSAFSPELTNPAGSAITSSVARFIQYRATFETTIPANTPTLNDVTISYTTRAPSGYLVSSTYDTTDPNNAIGGLSWTEGATLPAGTTVAVSLRTAQTAGGLIGPWTDFTNATAGCSKSSDTVTCPASAIPVPLTDGGDNRFVQYKVTEGTNGTPTPVVGKVVVTYFTTADQSPNTLIDTRPSGRISATTARFTFHATEAGSTFECKLDLGAFASCVSPKNYTGLADGQHTFQVRATDSTGHTDPTPTTARWTVDTTPPDTVIDSAPTGTIHTHAVTITFHAIHTTLTGNTFECKFSLATFLPCSSPKSYTLANGHFDFQVRATDSAGNIDPTPAIAHFDVSVP